MYAKQAGLMLAFIACSSSSSNSKTLHLAFRLARAWYFTDNTRCCCCIDRYKTVEIHGIKIAQCSSLFLSNNNWIHCSSNEIYNYARLLFSLAWVGAGWDAFLKQQYEQSLFIQLHTGAVYVVLCILYFVYAWNIFYYHDERNIIIKNNTNNKTEHTDTHSHRGA